MAKNRVDIRQLERGLKKLGRTFGLANATRELEVVALAVVGQARRSPVPRDTGALDASGFAVVERPGRVRFGFGSNAVQYAAVQDLGSEKMPPKPYGSDVGPNRYFSATLQDRIRSGWILNEVARRLRKRLDDDFGGSAIRRPRGPAPGLSGRRR